jgi:hypothetical protein
MSGKKNKTTISKLKRRILRWLSRRR